MAIDDIEFFNEQLFMSEITLDSLNSASDILSNLHSLLISEIDIGTRNSANDLVFNSFELITEQPTIANDFAF